MEMIESTDETKWNNFYIRTNNIFKNSRTYDGKTQEQIGFHILERVRIIKFFHSQMLETIFSFVPRDSVEWKDRNGFTPLFYAASYGHADAARVLLSKDADPNQQVWMKIFKCPVTKFEGSDASLRPKLTK